MQHLTVSSASNGVTQDNDTDVDGDDTVSSLTVTQIAVTGSSNSSVTSSTTYSDGTSVTGTYGTLVQLVQMVLTLTLQIKDAADDLDCK